jgi:beta-glucosidase
MFNKNFVFGCATASYQIEGAPNVDNKVPSIWDTFTKIKGNIDDSTDGSTCALSYYKYKEDVKLLKELGVSSYRFSIAWTRVMDENNNPNEKGIQYYISLCKELVSNGIKPLITLYHWDLPQWIQDKGGFLNRDIVSYFEKYVDVITKALSPYTNEFITVNEPQVILTLGHMYGVHAPGLKLSTKDLLVCVHNLLLMHGTAVKVIRKNVPSSFIGIAPCMRPLIPITKDDLLYKKCYEAMFYLDKNGEFVNQTPIYLDPIIFGNYPKNYYEDFKDILPDIKEGDLELISQKIDIIYYNFYTGTYASLDENNNLKIADMSKGYKTGNVPWLQVIPSTLYYGPKYLYERYKHPIAISENGYCNDDILSKDNKVHDEERIEYINEYLKELDKVSKEIDLRGYYYWSLLDNFEWNNGLSKRFGLVYINYSNNERVKKDSFFHYQNIIKNKGI